MFRNSPLLHILSVLTAILIVFVLRIQDEDLRPILGPISDASIRPYTPYFPGMGRLEDHEFFSPRNAKYKKIVFLGASSVDSIGCDGTWTNPDGRRQPAENAHYSCSIAAQMNRRLKAEGLSEWRAFDLARSGGKLTSMLYIYAKAAVLRPDIVVFGDTFPYYMADNADANALDGTQFSVLERTFGTNPATRQIWNSYRARLVDGGWRPPKSHAAALSGPDKRSRAFTLNNVLVDLMTMPRQVSAPPLPVKIANYRDWSPRPQGGAGFINPDPNFAYFEGLSLIADLQRQNGGSFFFYFSPEFDRRGDLAYQRGLEGVFGNYMTAHQMPWASHVALPLRTNIETYDGEHQTVYGNAVIAATILRDLQARGLLPLRRQ